MERFGSEAESVATVVAGQYPNGAMEVDIALLDTSGHVWRSKSHLAAIKGAGARRIFPLLAIGPGGVVPGAMKWVFVIEYSEGSVPRLLRIDSESTSRVAELGGLPVGLNTRAAVLCCPDAGTAAVVAMSVDPSAASVQYYAASLRCAVDSIELGRFVPISSLTRTMSASMLKVGSAELLVLRGVSGGTAIDRLYIADAGRGVQADVGLTEWRSAAIHVADRGGADEPPAVELESVPTLDAEFVVQMSCDGQPLGESGRVAEFGVELSAKSLDVSAVRLEPSMASYRSPAAKISGALVGTLHPSPVTLLRGGAYLATRSLTADGPMVTLHDMCSADSE